MKDLIVGGSNEINKHLPYHIIYVRNIYLHLVEMYGKCKCRSYTIPYTLPYMDCLGLALHPWKDSLSSEKSNFIGVS